MENLDLKKQIQGLVEQISKGILADMAAEYILDGLQTISNKEEIVSFKAKVAARKNGIASKLEREGSVIFAKIVGDEWLRCAKLLNNPSMIQILENFLEELGKDVPKK